MRKSLVLAVIAIAALSSCKDYYTGQLIGVQNRARWWQEDPYGMVYMPMGSYNMGESDQDVPQNFVTQSKTVSVQAFYMDQTEISNNEYRQFVYYVRDSLIRTMLGEMSDDYKILEDGDGNELDYDPAMINWRERIDYGDQETRDAIADLYYTEDQTYYRRHEIDVNKLIFDYTWIDLKAASKYSLLENHDRLNSTDKPAKDYKTLLETNQYMNSGDKTWKKLDRRDFFRHERINIYPDTLVWIRDFEYSYNEPMTKMYFWHPAYDNYPVVGINWKQATAFCYWRTELMNNFLLMFGDYPVHDFRLPTEAEWEYAARGGNGNIGGGNALSPYPWGGPYIRNSRGCFLGNFKPMRGNYIDDGGFHTVPVDSYNPNDYGLYCMAGNVSEWCSVAFEESGYSYMHDLNPDLQYDAKPTDPPVLQRKVIRGGSWKDIGFYMQVSARWYEYQDTSKSYIGIRCVQTFMGRDKTDFK